MSLIYMCRGFTGAVGRRHGSCLQIIKEGKKKKNLIRRNLNITGLPTQLRLAPERISSVFHRDCSVAQQETSKNKER